jgi:uncharacterized membrane protein YciS (DUF1049 family)
MNVTALFVELLMVGIGTATWLALFLAAILSYKFDTMILTDNKALIGTLIAIVYVLGIVMDRLIRGLFVSTLEARARKRIFSDEKVKHIKAIAPHIDECNLSMELEKFIRSQSQSLAGKIDYNRSRLRICRAWVLHFFLIGISFVCWNARVHVLPWTTAVWLIGVDALFLIFTWRATCLLAEDHQKDLIESFEIVAIAGKPKEQS